MGKSHASAVSETPTTCPGPKRRQESLSAARRALMVWRFLKRSSGGRFWHGWDRKIAPGGVSHYNLPSGYVKIAMENYSEWDFNGFYGGLMGFNMIYPSW